MSSALMEPAVMVLTYCHIMTAAGVMTPLGRDSVPLVYITLSTGHREPSGAGTDDAVLRDWSKSVHPVVLQIPAVAIAIRVVTSPPSSIASSAAATRSDCTMKPVARQCPRMYAISSGVSMKFSGTSTTAARAVANASTAYCQQLRASSAHTASGFQPVVDQSCRCAVDELVEFGEGQRHLAVDDRHLVRVTASRAPRNVTESVTAGGANQGVEPAVVVAVMHALHARL